MSTTTLVIGATYREARDRARQMPTAEGERIVPVPVGANVRGMTIDRVEYAHGWARNGAGHGWLADEVMPRVRTEHPANPGRTPRERAALDRLRRFYLTDNHDPGDEDRGNR
jgi:hypothetical protein